MYKLPKNWSRENEAMFSVWYGAWAKTLGLNPDPDDPRHFYDYRNAFLAGANPKLSPEDFKFHWPDEFKLKGHPTSKVQ